MHQSTPSLQSNECQPLNPNPKTTLMPKPLFGVADTPVRQTTEKKVMLSSFWGSVRLNPKPETFSLMSLRNVQEEEHNRSLLFAIGNI